MFPNYSLFHLLALSIHFTGTEVKVMFLKGKVGLYMPLLIPSPPQCISLQDLPIHLFASSLTLYYPPVLRPNHTEHFVLPECHAGSPLSQCRGSFLCLLSVLPTSNAKLNFSHGFLCCSIIVCPFICLLPKPLNFRKTWWHYSPMSPWS